MEPKNFLLFTEALRDDLVDLAVMAELKNWSKEELMWAVANWLIVNCPDLKRKEALEDWYFDNPN